jgi:hypothetical protein
MSLACSLFFHLNLDSRLSFLIKKLPVSLFADWDGDNLACLRMGWRDRLVTGCEACTECPVRRNKREKRMKQEGDMTMTSAASDGDVRKDSATGASLVFIASPNVMLNSAQVREDK